MQHNEIPACTITGHLVLCSARGNDHLGNFRRSSACCFSHSTSAGSLAPSCRLPPTPSPRLAAPSIATRSAPTACLCLARWLSSVTTCQNEHIQTRTLRHARSEHLKVLPECAFISVLARGVPARTFMVEPSHVRRAAARVLSARRHRAPLGQDQTAQDRWKSGRRWKTDPPSFSLSICVTWLIYRCDMTYSYLWHDPWIRVT